MKAKFYQHLRAENDRNGNPGRCFALYASDGSIVAVLDEGYRGTPKECLGLVQLPSVEISRGEYRDWLSLDPRKEKN